MERAEACGAGERDGWKDAELGVEKEPKQERQEKAGGGDLLPEVDRADPLRSGPRRALGLLRIGIPSRTARGEPSRTRKQKPEEAAEGTGITMVVWVGDKEEEPDGQQHERRCHAAFPDASTYYLRCDHLPPSRSRTS